MIRQRRKIEQTSKLEKKRKMKVKTISTKNIFLEKGKVLLFEVKLVVNIL